MKTSYKIVAHPICEIRFEVFPVFVKMNSQPASVSAVLCSIEFHSLEQRFGLDG